MNVSLRSKLRASTRAVLCVLAAGCAQQPEFDIVIHGGTVYDGSGAVPPSVRDIGLKGDRITAIGDLSQRRASEIVDATGKVVAPGFVDARGQSGVTLLADGYGESHLRQGITSEIIGDNSPAFWTMNTADVATLQRYGLAFDWNGFVGYFQKLESRGTAINVGTLVPSALAPGDENFLDAAMQAGAFGVIGDSTKPAELARLASVAGRYKGVFEASIQPGASPAEATEGLLDLAARTGTTLLVVDLISLEPPDMTVVAQHVNVSGQRGVRALATVIPYAATAGASDASVRALAKYGVVIGTNSAAVSATTPGTTTPAAFGAFPRMLGQWVRDDHLLDLGEAIRRATSVPASIFDLRQRGIIRENYFADIVVFDPNTIADRATFEKPNEYAVGIDYVIVNGVVTFTPKGLTGSRAGHRLLGPGARRPAS